MKKYIKHSILGLAMAFSLSACLKDLDQEPIDPDSFTEKDVFKNATEAKSALAKIYASMAVTGQKGLLEMVTLLMQTKVQLSSPVYSFIYKSQVPMKLSFVGLMRGYPIFTI